MKQARHNQFDEPLVNQPIAKYVFPERVSKELPDKDKLGMLEQYLPNMLMEELKHDIEYIHYFRSIATGKKYGGYYDYVPAIDPFCEEVFEARITTFNRQQEEITKLKEENDHLKAVMAEIRRR